MCLSVLFYIILTFGIHFITCKFDYGISLTRYALPNVPSPNNYKPIKSSSVYNE